MATDVAAFQVKSTSNDLHFRIPSGYERWIRRKESTHE
jgi:hypothetical protein